MLRIYNFSFHMAEPISSDSRIAGSSTRPEDQVFVNRIKGIMAESENIGDMTGIPYTTAQNAPLVSVVVWYWLDTDPPTHNITLIGTLQLSCGGETPGRSRVTYPINVPVLGDGVDVGTDVGITVGVGVSAPVRQNARSSNSYMGVPSNS